MADVKIPVSADFDSGDMGKIIQQFTAEMNRLVRSVAEANKVQFNPIDSAAEGDIKRVIQQFENLKKISSGLNQRMKATGQGGAGLFETDFHKLYEDQRIGARKALDVLKYVTEGTSLQAKMPKPAAAQPGGSGGGGDDGKPGASWRGVGARVFSAAADSMGGGGKAVGGAVRAGMSGGLAAGLFGLVGGLAAFGVSKAIGSVASKVGNAEQEGIRYDTLKRSLGDVNVGFNMLRASLRTSAAQIDVTFDEAQKLASEFSKISGLSQDQANQIADEVATGGGFSRSFGLDPSQGNQFFAQMRQFKATGSDADTRRMALMLGEGIVRSGAFSKADEMMQAIAGFTATQTRQSLSTANVEGYTGMIAGMVKSGIPGMDPQGSAAILAKINAAIAGGGGAGEAGQNFLYQAIGSQLGLDPIQTAMLQEGGAFASGRSVFGGANYQGFAGKYGLTSPGAATSDATNLEMLMKRLEKVYQGRPELMANALSNLFSISHSEAMAVSQISPEGIGGVRSRMSRLGKNADQLSMSNISTLAQIDSGDTGALGGIIRSLRDRTGKSALTEGERNNLNRAIEDANASGNDGPLRDILTELSIGREQEETEGSKTRDSIAGIDRRLQELASVMVGPMTDIRAGILYMAGGDGKKGPMEIMQAVKDAERKEIAESGDSEIARLNERFLDADAAVEAARGKLGTAQNRARRPGEENWRENRSAEAAAAAAELQAAMQKQSQLIENRQSQIDAINKKTQEKLEKYDLAQSGEKPAEDKPATVTGEPELNIRGKQASNSLFDALIQQESGGRHYGRDGNLLRSPAGALGITQVMPKTGVDPGFGVLPLRNQSEEEYRRFGEDYLNAMLKEFKGDRSKALAAYNAGHGTVKTAVGSHGDDWLAHMPKETRDYVASINQAVGSDPVPGDGAGAKKSKADNLKVDFTIRQEYPDGRPVDRPVNVTKRTNLPNASMAAMR